jgi:hypothetical protein
LVPVLTKEQSGGPGRGWEDGWNGSWGDGAERSGLDSSGSEWGPVAGSCERGGKPSGAVGGGEIPDWLRDSFPRS